MYMVICIMFLYNGRSMLLLNLVGRSFCDRSEFDKRRKTYGTSLQTLEVIQGHMLGSKPGTNRRKVCIMCNVQIP